MEFGNTNQEFEDPNTPIESTSLPRRRRKPEPESEITLADMFARSVLNRCRSEGEACVEQAPGRVRVFFQDGSFADVSLPTANVGESETIGELWLHQAGDCPSGTMSDERDPSRRCDGCRDWMATSRNSVRPAGIEGAPTHFIWPEADNNKQEDET